jgi:hypothetical protein
MIDATISRVRMRDLARRGRFHPEKAISGHQSSRAEDGLRPEPGERGSARLVVSAVDDQHPVEVIELVLDDPRRRELEL